MIRHFLSRQFLLFLAVGGTAAFLHWLSRIILSHWFSFSWAVILAYGVGMAVAFTLNSLLVFPGSIKPRHRQARDFCVVNLAFFPFVWAAAIAVERLLGSLGITLFREALAHGVAVSIPMFATFLAYKFFAFKDARYGRQ